MNQPDWCSFALVGDILREPGSDSSRIVLWLPQKREGSFQYWERLSNLTRAPVTSEDGLCAVAATTVLARQRKKGIVGKLLARFHQAGSSRAYIVPGGGVAEQFGERDSDVLLVWPADPNGALEDERVKSRWPQGRGYQRLGPRLCLVRLPAQPKAEDPAAEQMLPAPDVSPRQYAEQLVAAARGSGDRAGEAAALTDLGIIVLSEGDPRGAITLLDQALALARQLGDSVKEHDILGNLGMSLLHVNQPVRARELFERGLSEARSNGDPLAEKMALERLGLAQASLGDPARALALFEQALALTRQVGDRQQEANLLWLQAIQHAELGQREPAIARGQEAVTLFGKLGKPHASWYGAYLQKYRMGLFDTWPSLAATGVSAGPAAGPEAYLGGSLVASVVAGQATGAAAQQPGKSTTGPGLLRMALSATKAMAQFAGSGFKLSPPEIQRQRLQTCAACEHHTGLRCKICGCFTSAKSRILQESCPIGKWRA
jgi:tetratricopeptide (TPR) repeat protein